MNGIDNQTRYALIIDMQIKQFVKRKSFYTETRVGGVE